MNEVDLNLRGKLRVLFETFDLLLWENDVRVAKDDPGLADFLRNIHFRGGPLVGSSLVVGEFARFMALGIVEGLELKVGDRTKASDNPFSGLVPNAELLPLESTTGDSRIVAALVRGELDMIFYLLLSNPGRGLELRDLVNQAVDVEILNGTDLG
jgi:hypothetical protein